MAGKIKGITVEIGGDTTKLGKALKDISAKSNGLQKELTSVNRLLKLNPGNVTLLNQKQDLLNKTIAETKTKLDAMKQVMAKIDAGEVEVSEEEYRNLQREIVATEGQLKRLNDRMSEFGSVGAQRVAAAGEKMKDVGGKVEDAGKKMLPATIAIAGVGAASVKTAATFEASMSQVAATMGMTSEEINNGSEDYQKLEKAARDMGAATKYSASEAAEALNYLALAGYDVDKSVETLPTVLNLAAAGSIELGRASDMVTDAMSALGDKAGTAEQFVDKMAKTSQKSNTNVAQLGEAILTVGGTAKVLAGGTTELNTALGILADNGIKGAEGGTALRNMILSLSAPTDKAAEKMKALGLEVFDANGNMRPMNDIFKDLDKTLSTMTQGEQTQVLNSIFNKVDLKSVNALLANSGQRFDELSGYIADSKGAAADMADTMQNNLSGQLTILKSALDEAAISIGQALMPIIKSLVSTIQSLTDKFNALSPTVKTIIVVIAGIVAAIGPILIIVGKLLTTIGTIMTFAPKIVGIISVIKTAISGLFALVAAHPFVAAITAIIAIFVLLWNHCEAFRNFWIGLWDSIKQITSTVADTLIEFFTVTIPNAISGFAEKVSTVFTTVLDFIKNNWQQLLLLIVNPFAGAFALLYKNCDGFREFIDGFVQKIKDFFVNLGHSIVSFFTETIPNTVSSILSWFDALPEKLGYALGYAIGTLIEFGQNAISWVETNVPIIINNIVTFFSQLPGEIWTFLVKIVTDVATWGANMKDNAVTAVQKMITDVVNFMKELPSKIWDAIVSAVDKIATWGSDMKTKAQTAATNMVTSVISTAKEIPGKISSAISGAISAVATWGSNMLSKAKSAITSVADTIKNGLSSVPGAMASVGKNIVQGLWDGISGMVSWMTSKVKGFANSILGGIKSALGIHSPSTIFRDQVGRYISEGIGVGISENADSPISALEEVSDDMLDSARSINGITLNRQLENTFTGTVTAGGSVKDLVDMVSEYFPKLIEASKKSIVLDTGTLVGETINKIDEKLANNYTLKARMI